MELFDSLASVGLTTRILQIVIVLGIAIFIIGMYWRFIVAGAGIMFCVFVFASPVKTVDVVKVMNESTTQKEEERIVTIDPPPAVAEVKPKTDEDMFVEDCQTQTKYTQAQCKALWNEHKDEIEAVKYRGKNKKNYMMKVNYVRT